MDEVRRKKFLYGILGMALVFGLLNLKSIMSIGKKRNVVELSAPQTGSAPPVTTAAADSFAYERITSDKEKRLALGFNRNPFYRNAVAAVVVPFSSKEPVFWLTAVSVKGASAIAVINGRVLKVGDSIDGFVVKNIGKGSAVLNKGGSSIRLALRGE